MCNAVPITLVVDSRGLHRSSLTQSSPRDQSPHCDIHRLRLEYKSDIIDKMVCVPGTEHPVGALTKPHSSTTEDLLELMIVEGRLPLSIDDLRDYGPPCVRSSSYGGYL